jgi:hypothetical protein
MQQQDRIELHDDWKTSVESFDKIILAISSGAFAISLAFTDKIVTFNCARFNWLFILALCFFVTAVFISVFNYFFNIKDVYKYIRMTQQSDYLQENLDELQKTDRHNEQNKHLQKQIENLLKEQNVFRNQSDRKGNKIRISQVFSISIGTLSLFSYIIINSWNKL